MGTMKQLKYVKMMEFWKMGQKKIQVSKQKQVGI